MAQEQGAPGGQSGAEAGTAGAAGTATGTAAAAGTPAGGAAQSTGTPPQAAQQAAQQQQSASTTRTADATGPDVITLDEFEADEDEQGNSGKRVILTAGALKERLERARRREAEKYQRAEAERQRKEQEAQAAREQEEAIKRGEHERVISTQQTQLDDLKKQLAERDQQIAGLNTYKETVANLAKREMADLPPGVKELLDGRPPEEQLKWLDKHKGEYVTRAEAAAQTQAQTDPAAAAAAAGTAASPTTSAAPGTNGQAVAGSGASGAIQRHAVPSTPRPAGTATTTSAEEAAAESETRRQYQRRMF